MKKIILVASIIFAAITANSQTFTLKSNEIGGQLTNKQVFAGFGCEGENISPQLFWENAPKGTKSFAVTVYDSKAPTGSGWWHWVAFNIPAYDLLLSLPLDGLGLAYQILCRSFFESVII